MAFQNKALLESFLFIIVYFIYSILHIYNHIIFDTLSGNKRKSFQGNNAVNMI